MPRRWLVTCFVIQHCIASRVFIRLCIFILTRENKYTLTVRHLHYVGLQAMGTGHAPNEAVDSMYCYILLDCYLSILSTWRSSCLFCTLVSTTFTWHLEWRYWLHLTLWRWGISDRTRGVSFYSQNEYGLCTHSNSRKKYLPCTTRGISGSMRCSECSKSWVCTVRILVLWPS